MKAEIIEVEFQETIKNEFGTFHIHRIYYFDEKGAKIYGEYSLPDGKEIPFGAGQEASFNETIHSDEIGDPYIQISLFDSKTAKSNYSRAVSVEVAKYVSIGTSYTKDLVVGGKIEYEDFTTEAESIIMFMIELEKKIQNG